MAPLQQVDRHGGPTKCFGEFQRVVECMTNAKHTTFEPCQLLKDDYIECRKTRIERYKVFLMEKQIEESGKNKEEVGAPFVKKKQYLTPKTLGLVDGDDHSIKYERY
ncbi:unnamed protein product [Kuraishia capsulata CBS 1993]|uniref:Uncharacterized protein n=1 Tax=Kuraishia capsulata CBS 1993 TaxID=1382522 RepID=W6MPE5_9ASCO|nr:uncharacterized protein KUCA_T00004537001 [Kuraishia capsulata CBS 1993]CDK28554.1 unnamed protein product [Kuraishia capsulata CBS 1993]